MIKVEIIEEIRKGYTCGYTAITDYLRKIRPKKQEAFIPLEFENLGRTSK